MPPAPKPSTSSFAVRTPSQRDFNKALADLRRLQDARMELEMFQAFAPAAASADRVPEKVRFAPADPAVRLELQSRRL